ncbi:MAG: hypothetical protein E6G41_11960 [Actinobacteria bacterium]|nr:MAG: hypothetical protein E6G41_11960 [Actinomycetota bacterium]
MGPDSDGEADSQRSCLSARTLIATFAVPNVLGGDEALRQSRRPEPDGERPLAARRALGDDALQRGMAWPSRALQVRGGR